MKINNYCIGIDEILNGRVGVVVGRVKVVLGMVFVRIFYVC